MALKNQIKCNRVIPTKSQVFTLAAELVDRDNIYTYEEAIIQSLISFDYNYYNYYYYYYYYNNSYNYYYYNNNQQEKVMYLLFLAYISQDN